MDFNVKKLAADAGTFLSRAVQFTEEKLGQAEKTELDAHLENLLTKAESTKQWTEKIMKQTEVLLQPNPNARIEEFVYEKLDRKAPSRLNNQEQLSQYMIDAGSEFGPGTAYGNALIKCGETQKRIGGAHRELVQTGAINFLTPFRNFIEGDYKTISRERKLLQNKRLDLDAAKTRLKKAKVAEARASQLHTSEPERDASFMVNLSYMLGVLHVKWLQPKCSTLHVGRPSRCQARGTRWPRQVLVYDFMWSDLFSASHPWIRWAFLYLQPQNSKKMWTDEVTRAEQELRITQSEFDRQAEITRLLLEGISSTHAHHLRCLNDFVEAQMTYFAQCYQYMLDLQKQLGSFPTTFASNNNQSALTTMQSVSPPSISASAPLPAASNSVVTSGFSELKAASGNRKARVLYDYDAANSSELSLLADEVICVYSVPGMDSDWLMGERGNQKGKVPITYLELLN
ncbi:endophilin-B1 isoform 2-T2 [Anomaloglossus baeobatrachus]|uniref:endophilin-B1 isoform X2 n=1 Tax=Anomaloglossus baeobatrachus TaxID=238106 RepID=UPI003F4F4546